MPKVFISYSRDHSFFSARKFRDQLAASGHDVFLDTTSIGGGDDFALVIDREINAADLVVALWSNAALQQKWVRQENRAASELGKLFPIAVGELTQCGIPLEFKGINYLTLAPDENNLTDIHCAIEQRLSTKTEADRQQLNALTQEWPEIAVETDLLRVTSFLGRAIGTPLQIPAQNRFIILMCMNSSTYDLKMALMRAPAIVASETRARLQELLVIDERKRQRSGDPVRARLEKAAKEARASFNQYHANYPTDGAGLSAENRIAREAEDALENYDQVEDRPIDGEAILAKFLT